MRSALLAAGIDRAQGLAAVTADDNTNIIAARVARETFHVDHVVARIYDADRARLYQRLGIPTVASIQWTADQVLHRLLPQLLLAVTIWALTYWPGQKSILPRLVP